MWVSGYITPAFLGEKSRNVYVAHMWAKRLHPRRLARVQKSGMAMWPTYGQSGYISPAVLGVPNGHNGGKKQ